MICCIFVIWLFGMLVRACRRIARVVARGITVIRGLGGIAPPPASTAVSVWTFDAGAAQRTGRGSHG